MDEIITKVNLVIEPIDGFTGKREPQGTVFAKLGGRDNSYAMKKDNCLVFFNKPHGKYKVTVGGSCYRTEELEVELDDTVKTMTVVLMPSRSYKFSQTAVKIYGKADTAAKIRFDLGSEQARILGEYETGEIKINAFFSENDPAGYYFLGEEAYCLKHLHGTEYELDRPLENAVDLSARIGICREVIPGEYFIAVRGRFKTAEIITENARKIIEISSENNEHDIINGEWIIDNG